MQFDGPAAADLLGVLITALVAALVIAVPTMAVQLVQELAQPGRAIGSGFPVTAALAGSGVLLMLTIVGLFLPTFTGFAIPAGRALRSCVPRIGRLAAFVLPERLLPRRTKVMP